MAGHEVGLVDIIRSTDGLIAEAQVADGDAAGFLGVVLEVGLDVFVRVVSDDLDGVFVGAHGSVAAETPEFALDGALRRGVGGGLLLQAQVGDAWARPWSAPHRRRRRCGAGCPCCPGRSGRR